jgi:hypothetical protein
MTTQQAQQRRLLLDCLRSEQMTLGQFLQYADEDSGLLEMWRKTQRQGALRSESTTPEKPALVLKKQKAKDVFASVRIAERTIRTRLTP